MTPTGSGEVARKMYTSPTTVINEKGNRTPASQSETLTKAAKTRGRGRYHPSWRHPRAAGKGRELENYLAVGHVGSSQSQVVAAIDRVEPKYLVYTDFFFLKPNRCLSTSSCSTVWYPEICTGWLGVLRTTFAHENHEGC